MRNRKKKKNKEMYHLWFNDFESWAKNQRANCERMIEKSREKHKIATGQTPLDIEFEEIVQTRLC